MNAIRTLTPREIECRVSMIKKNGLQLLLYKDARVDMSILDETFGPMNWMRHHSRDNANCIISVWDESKECWVDKEDTGTESNTEAEKGLASDSFKRAGVNWGIGRELYTAPFIWITPPNCEIKENDRGKLECRDRFEVSDIGYNEHREINRLQVINSSTHNVVFEFADGKKKPIKATPKKEEEEPADEQKVDAEVSTAIYCERCNQVITGVALAGGKTMTASEIIGKSKMTYGGVYCFGCMMELNKKRKG